MFDSASISVVNEFKNPNNFWEKFFNDLINKYDKQGYQDYQE